MRNTVIRATFTDDSVDIYEYNRDSFGETYVDAVVQKVEKRILTL